MDGNLGDSVGPDAVGDADLKLVAAWRGIVLDDQEACALVQHEVARRQGTNHTHTNKTQLELYFWTVMAH